MCFDCIQRVFLSLWGGVCATAVCYGCVLRSVSYCAAHAAGASPDVVKLTGYGGACLLELLCLGGTSYEGLCFMLEWQQSMALEGDIERRATLQTGVRCIACLRNVAAYVACFLARHVFG